MKGRRSRNSKYSPYQTIDMTGTRCHRWLILRYAGKSGSQLTWECQCDCGNIRIVRGGDLRSGASKSCGCLAVKMVSKHIHKNTEYPQRHGGTKDLLYWIWSGIIERCVRSKISNYTVCEEWKEFPAKFIDDMHSIGWKKGDFIYLKEGKTEYNKNNVYLSKRGEKFKDHFTKNFKHYRNLEGKKFGHLTVVESFIDDKARVKCKCDCGNEHTSTADLLVSGRKKTCGCKYGGKWSMFHSYCQNCKRTDRPHHSRGICTGCRCYLTNHGLIDNFKTTKKKYKNHI